LGSLPKYRKVYKWNEAMMNKNIWHQCFFNGTVKSETNISRRALALEQIYDHVNAKKRTSPPNGTNRILQMRLPVLLHEHNTRIQI
jgi:hypothetical protein